MQAKIYITYHKSSHLVNGVILSPIQVGTGPDLPGCVLRDDSGVNIAHLNDRYCEMTAAYWVWKNDCSHDFIGLLHYRRFFDFHETCLPLDEWGVVNWPAFTTDFESQFGLDDQSILAAISGYDVVLPRKWSVRNAGYRNLREHYASSPYHHESDLILCRDVIASRHPEYLPSWRLVLNSDRGWFNNMFILRRDIFIAYCNWLFPLLEEVELLIPFDNYGEQERRVMGYLAERLLNVWLHHYLASHPNTKLMELDRVFIKDPSPKLWDPGFKGDCAGVVSVVIASDDHYAPHLGALIVSIFDNISSDATVDLLVLDGGISEENQDLLMRLVPAGSSLHFIPMRDEFTHYFTHMHFSRATFFRLVLDGILKSRDKVIYIDCDTIVLGDLCELWEIDMEDKSIAAVHDYIMDHFCKSKVLSADFTGSLPARAYLRDYVGISAEHCDHYFQAGLLIMNLSRIREQGLAKRMTDSLLAKKYWFLDQDILNKYFCGSHINLPAEWNFVNCTDDISASLDQDRALELRDARKNLKLIHYAGYEAKPWVNSSAYLSEYYFYYLRRTFWYEQVLGRSKPCVTQEHHHPSLTHKWRRSFRTLWRRLPWFLRRIANPLAFSVQRRLMGR